MACGRTGVERVASGHGRPPPLLQRAVEHAVAYRSSLPERPVRPELDVDALAAAFGGPLQAEPLPPGEVLEQLAAAAEPGLVATAGPRFFGFVIGGALPAATAADVLAAGWDQVAFNNVASPAAAAAERAAGTWLKQLLGLPETGVGRLRHRRPGREHRRPRGRSPPPAAGRWAGTSSGRG